MKDIIQKMRHEAHEIACKRRNEWWESLTAEQKRTATARFKQENSSDVDELEKFKPGVIELDPDHPPTPYAVQMQLMLLGVFVSLDDLVTQPRAELEAVALWAATAMLSASDNDVVIAPRPEWLPSRDSANVEELVEADIRKHGGEESVRIVYGEDWVWGEAGPPEAPDHSHEPKWAQRLRAIADVLMDIAPDEFFDEGRWLHDWLDAGAPMFDPAKSAPAQDSPDTSVGEQFSTESPDGYASGTEVHRVTEHTQRTD